MGLYMAMGNDEGNKKSAKQQNHYSVVISQIPGAQSAVHAPRHFP